MLTRQTYFDWSNYVRFGASFEVSPTVDAKCKYFNMCPLPRPTTGKIECRQKKLGPLPSIRSSKDMNLPELDTS